MGNKSGRMIAIEKQPKDGSALDPGSFVKQVSPSKLKLTHKATPKVVSWVTKLPIPHVNPKAKSKTNPPSVHLTSSLNIRDSAPPIHVLPAIMSMLNGCAMTAQMIPRVIL